jgi:hypothetical protein
MMPPACRRCEARSRARAPDRALAAEQQEQRDARHRMRDQQREVDDRREHGASRELATGQEVRDRRAAEHAEQRRRGRGEPGEHERGAQFGVAAEAAQSGTAAHPDEFEHRGGEEQQEQRSRERREHAHDALGGRVCSRARVPPDRGRR